MSDIVQDKGDDFVTINVSITFDKRVEIAHPGGTAHEIEISCLAHIHRPLIIEPLGALHGLDKDYIDHLIRQRSAERAIISLALAIADIQFEESISKDRERMMRCGGHNPHPRPRPRPHRPRTEDNA